ncbi:MAG: RIP metalloprotease RseP [Flavisolibacter sp.]
MVLLAIDWSAIGVKAAQFILSFSILVILHEMGHFLPAKWFRCRVEKFYLFFNPWFSLWKKKIGETVYGLGWIPLGGYVKIAGMIDESMDKDQLKQPAQPWEFRSKPAWQRLIIMLGGVTVNVLLALVIFIMITWVWGDEYLPPQNVKYGLAVDSLGRSIGMKDGDVIVKVGNEAAKDELSVTRQIITSEAHNITVDREGRQEVLNIPDGMIKELNRSRGADFASVRFKGVVDSFPKGSNAEKAGMKKNDVIIGADSLSTPYFQDFQKEVRAKKNQTIVVKVLRNRDTVTIPIPVNADGTIGFWPVSNIKKLGLETETKKYSLFAAVPAGIRRCWNTLTMYVTGLKQLFTGKANPKDSLGSVISIGNIFPGVWDWESFWSLTAIFSIILAFMNVLPIPGLDGGHALFTVYEIITRRKPSDRFMEYAQMAGMVLLMSLMLYAFGLDIWRLFK